MIEEKAFPDGVTNFAMVQSCLQNQKYDFGLDILLASFGLPSPITCPKVSFTDLQKQQLGVIFRESMIDENNCTAIKRF